MVVLKLGYLFGGPNNKDYSILGSMLGSHYLRKLPLATQRNEPSARVRSAPQTP